MEPHDLNLMSISSKAIKYWWLMVIAGTIGGLIGFLLSILVIPPLYSASSEISAQIDFTDVGHLTQYEQDQFHSHLMSFARSDEVIFQTLDRLSAPEIEIGTFRSVCKAERQLSQIVFRCQDIDPERSAEMANSWQAVAYSAIEEALFHARQYRKLTTRQQQIEACIQRSVSSPESIYECNFNEDDLNLLAEEIESERKASAGLVPGFSLSLGSTAVIADSPVRHQTGLMVLAGASLGFLLSFFLPVVKKK